MAFERPRMDVPIHFDWVDDDQYANDGGVPTSSMLGRKLTWMDRALLAHNLRGLGNAFSQYTSTSVDLPEISDANGTIVGPFIHYGSDGSTQGEWYIRASLPATETAIVVPFADYPPNLEPLVGPIDDADHTITGAAAAAITNYGPFPCRVRPKGMSIGIAIYPTNDGAAFEKADIEAAGMTNRNTFITDNAGSILINTWVGATTELQHMVRLLDGSDNVLTPWKRIVSVTTTVVGNPNDTVTFWPGVRDSLALDDLAKGNLQWQSMMMNPVTLYSVMFREKPAAGEDYMEALYRG